MILVYICFQILELSYFEDKPDRFDSVDALLEAVKQLQHYAILRQQLTSGYVDLPSDCYS